MRARARVCCRARVICTTMPDACTLPVGRTTCTERTHAEIYSLSRRYNASRSTPQCFEQYCSNALFLCPPVSLAREGKRRRWVPMPAARFGVGTDLGILSLRLGDCRSEEGRDGGGGRGGREGGEGGEGGEEGRSEGRGSHKSVGVLGRSFTRYSPLPLRADEGMRVLVCVCVRLWVWVCLGSNLLLLLLSVHCVSFE